jgi:hypothetical protein
LGSGQSRGETGAILKFACGIAYDPGNPVGEKISHGYGCLGQRFLSYVEKNVVARNIEGPEQRDASRPDQESLND